MIPIYFAKFLMLIRINYWKMDGRYREHLCIRQTAIAQLFDAPVSCFDVSNKLIKKLRKKYYRKYVRSHKVAERYRSNTNLNEHVQRAKGWFELREAVYEDILGDLQQL